MSRRTDSNTITAAPSRMSTPSRAEARFSTFSCPYMWVSSAGSSALRTEKKATTDASRSMLEWTASVRIATEPVAAPATIFNTISDPLDATDRRAARAFDTGATREASLKPQPSPPRKATSEELARLGRGG